MQRRSAWVGLFGAVVWAASCTGSEDTASGGSGGLGPDASLEASTGGTGGSTPAGGSAGTSGTAGASTGGVAGMDASADAVSDAGAAGSSGASDTGATGGTTATGGTGGSGGSGASGGSGGTGTQTCTYTHSYCTGADLYVCIAGQKPNLAATCKSPQHCNATTSACMTCLPSTTYCQGIYQYTCDANGSPQLVALCPDAGPDAGECYPLNAPYCDGSDLYMCDSLGKKKLLQSCVSAQACQQGQPQGVCACSNGAITGVFCKGSDLYDCQSGNEVLLEQCASTASCTAGIPYKHCGCTTTSVTPTALNPTVIKVGNPDFKPVGLVVYAAQVGNNPIQMEWMGNVIDSVLKPLHQVDYTKNIIAPMTPHAPPYDSELPDGVTAAGLVASSTFGDCQVFPPNGIMLQVMIVPDTGAPNGKSFDSVSGPIVPNTDFPMFVGQDTYLNGVLTDPTGDANYPPSTFVTPATDGYSHVIYTWATGVGWVPPGMSVKGNYVWKIEMYAANGGGWSIDVPFVVQ
jgi:hypothetical protein